MRGPVFTSFLLLFSISVVSGFKIASYSYHNHYVSMRTVSNVGVMRRGMKICRPSTILRNSESELDVHEDEAEETLLRINFSYPTSSTSTDDDKGSLALAAVQKYTKSFPFAAVLPVQPLTYLPVKMPDGTPAVKVTFLRKKVRRSLSSRLRIESCAENIIFLQSFFGIMPALSRLRKRGAWMVG